MVLFFSTQISRRDALRASPPRRGNGQEKGHWKLVIGLLKKCHWKLDIKTLKKFTNHVIIRYEG